MSEDSTPFVHPENVLGVIKKRRADLEYIKEDNEAKKLAAELYNPSGQGTGYVWTRLSKVVSTHPCGFAQIAVPLLAQKDTQGSNKNTTKGTPMMVKYQREGVHGAVSAYFRNLFQECDIYYDPAISNGYFIVQVHYSVAGI